MSLTVRGIRDTMPAGTLAGNLSRFPQAAQKLTLLQLVKAIGAGSQYASVLGAVPPIANLDLLANVSGAPNVATGITLSQFLDAVLGANTGLTIVRGATGWEVASGMGDTLTWLNC
jgi:hypothetical protein